MLKIWKQYRVGNGNIIPYSTRLMNYYFGVRFYYNETWLYKLFAPVELFKIETTYYKNYTRELRKVQIDLHNIKY